MLTVHIREFCQVSPDPLPHFACGPGNEANYYVCKQGRKRFLVPCLEIADDSTTLGECSTHLHSNCVFAHFAVITVGYVQTAVTVFEDAGVAQLTVAISVPPQADPIDTSFFLLVNTNDGTAAGLSPCLEFDLHTVHTSLTIATRNH